MPNWKETQKMIKEARTPQEKTEALQALGENISPEMQQAHLSTLSKGSNANSVKLSDLPQHGDNPEVFDRVKDLLGNGE